MAGSQTDITARRLAEEQLAYGALHDGLTGLSNRELFMDRLGQKIEHTKRHPESLFAILFMDVDRFKVVNDSLGHTAGDQLLVAIGRRLQLCLRPEDTVSRLSGDEFAILLNEVNDINDAIRVAERIQARMRETTVLSAVNRSTTVSIGIAMFSDKYVQPQDMLRDADIAMYRAKALGGGRYETFSKDMHTQALALLQLEADLKRAVKNKEWLVYYQPIISMSSGEIAGVEALVRWNHPQRGILAPCEFIANAEESGVILAIDEYVLREACSQVLALQYAGHPELWVAVNISGRQFQDPNLPQTIKRILNETGLPGNCLRLEITEGVAMKDIEHSLSILKNLEKLDIQLTLDDFGTEYSSLSYLRRFPFKVMKIDRSFIQDITIDKNGEAITTAIISMGHSLNLTVVAEGVESTEQFSFLKKQFCDEVQGFLISKPMPSDELRKVFNGQSRYLIPKANDGWFRK
jgi:diguanylate cyclase (GGDEF)-like protein